MYSHAHRHTPRGLHNPSSDAPHNFSIVLIVAARKKNATQTPVRNGILTASGYCSKEPRILSFRLLNSASIFHNDYMCSWDTVSVG